jgi:hypothetical protein
MNLVQNRNANQKESNGNLFQNHKEIIRNLMGKSTGIPWNLYNNYKKIKSKPMDFPTQS